MKYSLIFGWFLFPTLMALTYLSNGDANGARAFIVIYGGILMLGDAIINSLILKDVDMDKVVDKVLGNKRV